jgi:hypothetical protein
MKEAAAEDFHKSFSAAFPKDSEFKNHVTHYTMEQLKGMKCYLSADGKVGMAVHDHGDGRVEGTALFNNGGGRGAGSDALRHAVRNAGVNYVECYGPKLNKLYKEVGFGIDSKSRFDRGYAASDWSFRRFDSPNYYKMKLPKAD